MDLNEKEIHLRDYLKVILKRKKIILAFFFVTFATVIVGSIKSTPLFKANVKLQIEKNSSNPLRGDFRYVGYDPEFFSTQTEVISSKAVAEKVVEYLDLVNSYSTFFPNQEKEKFSLIGSLTGSLKKLLKNIIIKNEKAENKEETNVNYGQKFFEEENSPESIMADIVRGGIIVSPVQQSKVMNVSYISQNPIFSALIVNNIARAYIERLLEMRMENITYTIDWMKEKAAEERGKLEKSEIKLAGYLKKKDIVTIEDRIAILPQKLTQLNKELTDEESKRLRLEEVINQIKKTNSKMLGSIPVVASNRTFQEIRKKIFYKNQQILEMSQKYGSKHPVMKRMEKELETLENNRKDEVQRIVMEVNNDYELAFSNVKNLRKQLEKTKDEASRLNEEFIQYRILKREVETNKQLYQALVTRIKEQTITKQTRNVDVWVIEKAKIPIAPFNQNMKRNILLGIVLGLFGGVGLAFFLEYIDNTISMPEDAEEKTGVPVIGSIGVIEGNESERNRLLLDSPDSPYAEPYKVIRASLFLATQKGLPSSLMITSSASGEGKTLTSSNLAAAIAISGKKVLLIDSDLRRPKLHTIFNVKNDVGFSSILTGQNFKDVVVKGTGVNNLHLIPSGEKPLNPSELLFSDFVKDLITFFEKHYDIVIFDSPPVGIVSDPIMLAQKVEKTLIVTRSGVTKYEDVKNCIKKVSVLDLQLLGLVVNAVNYKKEGYYNSYYSSEYYS